MGPRRLRREDLLDEVRGEISAQTYAPRPTIAGVALDEVRVSRSPDGLFAELGRIGDEGQLLGVEGFQPVQWNWSLLEPGAVKAWHLHLDQDDVFIIPPVARLLVGLADLRRDSPTAKGLQRLVLGAGRCDRLLIPRGVAHGVANLGREPQALLYAVNSLFTPDPEKTDELRLRWDRFGAEFWSMERG
jgi:dTDP-4-dehydrorhamnose 3,5-epimerase